MCPKTYSEILTQMKFMLESAKNIYEKEALSRYISRLENAEFKCQDILTLRCVVYTQSSESVPSAMILIEIPISDVIARILDRLLFDEQVFGKYVKEVLKNIELLDTYGRLALTMIALDIDSFSSYCIDLADICLSGIYRPLAKLLTRGVEEFGTIRISEALYKGFDQLVKAGVLASGTCSSRRHTYFRYCTPPFVLKYLDSLLFDRRFLQSLPDKVVRRIQALILP